ncbi:hypothetical protein BDW66DRAFT_154258 [Aspergillus desertorum]
MPVRWRREEDEILRACVEEYTELGRSTDWSRVAAKLPFRTNKDCRKRWVNHVCGSLRKGPWEADEDMALREAVARHGRNNPLDAGGRWSPAKLARDLRTNVPNGGSTIWIPDWIISGGLLKRHDELLLESVERYGREWRKIQEKHYSTRSANDLKNRFSILSKKITSRPPSRSGLGYLSSSSSVVVGDPGQEGTSSDTNLGTTSCLDSGMLPAEGWEGVYNPKDPSIDVDQPMESATNIQQPEKQQMRSGNQAVPLQPLDHAHHLMALDDPDHAAASSSFFWPLGTTSSPRAGSGPFTQGNFSNTMLFNGPAAMSYDLFHPVQTDARDSNGLDRSSRSSSNVADLQLGFDTSDPVPDSTKNDHLLSLLTHRAGRLGNGSPGGSVFIQAKGCDREVLNYVLDVLLPIRHLVKMEINM